MSSDIYRTSDTALAAFLITAGFDSPDIEYANGNRAYFLFEASDNLLNSISTYDTARATGNIVLFFNVYQSLLRRIKER